jgi:hypothetical protein
VLDAYRLVHKGAMGVQHNNLLRGADDGVGSYEKQEGLLR